MSDCHKQTGGSTKTQTKPHQKHKTEKRYG